MLFEWSLHRLESRAAQDCQRGTNRSSIRQEFAIPEVLDGGADGSGMGRIEPLMRA